MPESYAELMGRTTSIRSETRVFQKPRHPGRCRDPGDSASYWIPAFAGMTGDAVYGWALTKALVLRQYQQVGRLHGRAESIRPTAIFIAGEGEVELVE